MTLTKTPFDTFYMYIVPSYKIKTNSNQCLCSILFLTISTVLTIEYIVVY